ITTAINGPGSRPTTPYYDEKTGVPGYDSVTMLAAGITHAGTIKELGGAGTVAGGCGEGGDQRRPSSNVRHKGNGGENLTPSYIPYGGGATGRGNGQGNT